VESCESGRTVEDEMYTLQRAGSVKQPSQWNGSSVIFVFGLMVKHFAISGSHYIVWRLIANIQKNCAFCDTSTKFGTSVY